ncbi:MAG: hypothetical protein IPK32_19965 [Verrucomicrobiaceae bacterium]|nr:hypothetical protein [Verrucomicrobiaceae bacterium]
MKPYLILSSALCFLFAVSATAQSTMALTLTHHEQAAALGEVTKSEQAAWMRDQVRASRYGQRGLDNLFKGFKGPGFIDPSLPGVTKNIRALASASKAQTIGARRTLLYATKVYHDSRFDLVAVDQLVSASYGLTDKDLVLRHLQTGLQSRIEVKDVKPASQRSDLERIKGQLDKMAAEYRRTGELQAWANRQETIPAIKEYGRQKGVPIYEKTTQADFPKILDDLERRSVVETRVKISSSLLGTGAGVALLYSSTAGLLEASQADLTDVAARLRLGEQASLFVAGGSFTSSGFAQIGSRLAITENSLAKLGAVTKWGGRAGIAGIILAEGLGIGIDYYNWDQMTARQQSISKVQHSVSLCSMALAFGAGVLFGIETGPGAIVFGIASAGAAYAATQAATSIVAAAYDRLDAEQKLQVTTIVYQRYGIAK